MTVILAGALRSRLLPAIATSVVAAICIISVEVARGGTSAGPSVGDYLARMCRATGLRTCPDRGAPVDAYVSFLVQQRAITSGLSKGLGADDPLTHDLILEVASGITDLPTSSFLSKSYVVNTFLAD